MSLDFLKNVAIDDTKLVKKRAGGGGGSRKNWVPTTPNSIRVWSDGSVFPSADLVERFELEYSDRPVETQGAEGEAKTKWLQPGSAFDVFDSNDFPVLKTPQRVIIANVTSKAAGKADLFASVTWDEEGKIQNSVLDQGAATFGKASFIPMLEEVYGIKFSDDVKFVDLVLIGKDGEKAMEHFPLPADKQFCYVPKRVSRGEKKGAETIVRREDPWLYILYPLAVLHPEAAAKETAAGSEPDTQA